METRSDEVLALVRERMESFLPEGVLGIEAHCGSIKYLSPSKFREISNGLQAKENKPKEEPPKGEVQVIRIRGAPEKGEIEERQHCICYSPKLATIEELIDSIQKRLTEEPSMECSYTESVQKISFLIKKITNEIVEILSKLQNEIFDRFFPFPGVTRTFLEKFSDGMLNDEKDFNKELGNVLNLLYFTDAGKQNIFDFEKFQEEITRTCSKMTKKVKRIKADLFADLKDYRGFEKKEVSFGKQVISEMLFPAQYMQEKGITPHPRNKKKYFFLNREGKAFEITKSKTKFEGVPTENFCLPQSNLNGIAFSPSGCSFLIFQATEDKKIMVFFKKSTRLATKPDFVWPKTGKGSKYLTTALFFDESTIVAGYTEEKLSIFQVGVPSKPIKTLNPFKENPINEIAGLVKATNHDLLVVGRLCTLSCLDIKTGQTHWVFKAGANNLFYVGCTFLPKSELVFLVIKYNLIAVIDFKSGQLMNFVEVGEDKLLFVPQFLAVNPKETCLFFQRDKELLLIELCFDKKSKEITVETTGNVKLATEKMEGKNYHVNSMVCVWEKNQIVLGNSFGSFAVVKLNELRDL